MRAKILSLGIVFSVIAGLAIGPAGHAATGTGTTYYFHAVNAPVQTADLVTGGATFDTTPPQFTDDAYAVDPPGLVNTGGGGAGDPGWTGKVAGPITSLGLDFWSKATAGEALGQVDYDTVLWVGTTEYDLPTLTVTNVDPTSFNEIKGTFTTMLDASGNEVPLNIDPGNNDVSINIRGVYVVDEAAATIAYDSTSHPSSFTVTSSGGPAPSPSSSSTSTAPPPPPPGGSITPQTLKGSISFSTPIELPQSSDTGTVDKTCYNPCGEPSLVQAPNSGTIYVSTPRTLVACCNTKASPVWKSTDGGRTWSDPIFPTSTIPGGEAGTGGDTQMAVDSHDNLYEGELYLANDSMFISPDEGQTWTSSPFSHDVGTDREWLVYNPKDDALYGWYDGLKAGLETIRAPLNTAAGNKTALLAPQERIAVPVQPTCASLVCAGHVNSSQLDQVNGVPILNETESPGIPAVDPQSGTVYFPFGYQVAGKGIGIAETTDGLNFTYQYVSGAGHGAVGDVDNDFPVAAVDTAGTLYIAWVEDKSGNDNAYHVYLSSSKDKGATWNGPTDVSGAISKTAVFPTMAAGADGRVVVGWYGTDVAGNNNDVNVMKDASWNVYVAESTNAASANPTFDQVENVDPNFHTGTVSTGGLGGSADRSLLDFFTVGIDNKSGNADLTYTRDKGAGTAIMFAKQNGGCNMLTTDPCAAAPSPTPTTTTTSSPSSSPTPTAQGTSLAFTANVPASGQFTDQVPVAAQLKDSSGNPLPGQKVLFDLSSANATRHLEATTDANGIASTQLTLDLHPGDFRLTADYAGTANLYKSSGAAQPFAITKEDSAMSAYTNGSGSKKTITARLTQADDATSGISGVVVSLYADGSYVSDGTTDGSGTAVFNAPAGSRGNKSTYEVRFVGNGYYAPSGTQAT